MFYATRIQSVGNGYAVDVQGKALSFIGDFPVKVGDTVFTDGNIIFGHIPQRGAPAIFQDEPSGIPVITGINSIYGGRPIPIEQTLRGYFTLQGVYKKYRIAGDYWITNAHKIYRHDNGADNIIDAEFARDDNGNEIGYYTAEKIINLIAPNNYFDFDGINFQIGNYDFCSVDNDVKRACKIIIKKNSVMTSQIDIREFATSVENQLANIIPQHNLQDDEFYEHYQTRIRVENFKIEPDGNWTALALIEVAHKRGIFERTYKLPRIYTNRKIDSETVDLEELPSIEGWTYWGVLGVGVGYNFVRGLRSLTTARYVTVDALQATVDYTTRSFTETIPETKTFTHIVSLIKFSSDTLPEVLFTKTLHRPPNEYTFQQFILETKWLGKCSSIFAGYGVKAPVYDSDSASGIGDTISWKDLLLQNGYIDQAELDSLKENHNQYIDSAGYKVQASSDTGYYGNSFYTAPKNLFGTISKDANHEENFTVVYHITLKKYLDEEENIQTKITQSAESYFFFPAQDGYSVKLINYGGENQWTFGGIFDKNGNQVVGAVFNNDYVIAHTDNYSCVPLKGKQFLLGLREKQIFKIGANGYATEIADNLRNFRLRELKKIRIAKK